MRPRAQGMDSGVGYEYRPLVDRNGRPMRLPQSVIASPRPIARRVVHDWQESRSSVSSPFTAVQESRFLVREQPLRSPLPPHIPVFVKNFSDRRVIASPRPIARRVVHDWQESRPRFSSPFTAVQESRFPVREQPLRSPLPPHIPVFVKHFSDRRVIASPRPIARMVVQHCVRDLRPLLPSPLLQSAQNAAVSYPSVVPFSAASALRQYHQSVPSVVAASELRRSEPMQRSRVITNVEPTPSVPSVVADSELRHSEPVQHSRVITDVEPTQHSRDDFVELFTSYQKRVKRDRHWKKNFERKYSDDYAKMKQNFMEKMEQLEDIKGEMREIEYKTRAEELMKQYNEQTNSVWHEDKLMEEAIQHIHQVGNCSIYPFGLATL